MQARIIKLFIFILLLSAGSCLPVRDISTMNMSYVYRPIELAFHPEFTAFNVSDSSVRLFVKLLPAEFLYVRQMDQNFRSFASIHADIIASYEQTQILDSVTSEFSFELTDKENYKVLSMDIPIKNSGMYLVHIFISDKFKGNTEDYFIQLDRLSKPSRQDFLVTSIDNVPLFRNYLYALDTVNIKYRDSSVQNFSCEYYYRDFPLAAPPYTFDMHDNFNYYPDSLFNFSSSQLNGATFPMEGFYHFQTDTSGKAGLTLFRFRGGFPDINSAYQMIDALRYLTSKKEFEEMKNSASPKAMVDNFWLTHGGNEEKTRLLIKKYYGRVKDANKFFTSYTEGWRTDRGMIYVIFGSPGTIYRGSESESWTYGTPNSTLALNFFFLKVNNPFTENDFTLSRSPIYESNWDRAVEIWRQGRAYNSFY